MSGLEFAAGILAVIDMSVKIGVLLVDYSKAVTAARDDIKRLQRESASLKDTLKNLQSLQDGPEGARLAASRMLRGGLSAALGDLNRLKNMLDAGVSPTASRIGRRSLRWPFRKGEVKAILEDLARCRGVISLALEVDQTAMAHDIHLAAQRIEQKIDLSGLPVVESAAHDSYANQHDPRCHPETRVDLLNEIIQWADDPAGKRVFWLNGMAGTGKTTISRTLAERFSSRGILGANFFFKRGEGDRGHAACFFSTVAGQLARVFPFLACHIRDAIERDSAVTGKALGEQFERLVLEPLQAVATDSRCPSTILAVVDALDECDGEDDIRVIIRLLSYTNRLPSPRFKVFVTSRPELPIRLGFEDVSGEYTDLVLHSVPEPVIEHDIAVVLDYELARIRTEFNKTVPKARRLLDDWPSPSETQSLVKMAIPLFIFAATACRFIQNQRYGRGSPAQRLEQILQYHAGGQGDSMDATYLPVLNQLLLRITGDARDAVVDEFRRIVGPIVVLASPLSVNTLSQLLEIPSSVIACRLDFLHSVLKIPNDEDEPIRLFHLSFRDFLLDRRKKDINCLWIDEKTTHQTIAYRCILLLSEGGYLHKNVCSLPRPGDYRKNVSEAMVQKVLPSSVQYACLYWIYHVVASESIVCDDGYVHAFLQKYLLQWTRVLCFLSRAADALEMLSSLRSRIAPMGSTGLSGLLDDAERFLLLCHIH